jgi:D-arabinose 1-dehydrogenase-like Zn-dependent alcohol dehydrogenase
VFFLQLRVVGSTIGTRDELSKLARLCETSGLRPEIDRVLPLSEARDGFAAMAAGDVFGKIVFSS